MHFVYLLGAAASELVINDRFGFAYLGQYNSGIFFFFKILRSKESREKYVDKLKKDL